MIQFRDYEVNLLIRACMKIRNSSSVNFSNDAYDKLLLKLNNYLNELDC